MRQRNVKNLEERIEQNSEFLIKEPGKLRGKWAEEFGNDNPIYLEIGCGKGQFIRTLALRNRDVNYVAVEGQNNVALRVLEKASESGTENLRIFMEFIHDLNDYFVPGEIKGIYLNFSDPWPKACHAKRRLTHHRNLENYMSVLGNEGIVEFKTDNDGLFGFTLEELENGAYEILEMTRDLHKTELKASEVTTEYEDKFSSQGKNINYVKFRLNGKIDETGKK